MKTLIFSFAALIFAFFLGCESTITNPEVSQPLTYGNYTDQEYLTYKDVISNMYPNKILLSGILLDPSHRLNSYAEIDGVIRYGIQEVKRDIQEDEMQSIYKSGQNGTTTNRKFKVNLYFDALLKGGCSGHNEPWVAKKATYEIVEMNVSNSVVVNFKKTVRVCHTCCAPLNLVFTFKVVRKELVLVTMNLELAQGIKSINFPE
jgi:hypothetical protein